MKKPRQAGAVKRIICARCRRDLKDDPEVVVLDAGLFLCVACEERRKRWVKGEHAPEEVEA